MPAGSGPSTGALLQGLGRRLVGKKVMRHWPENGGWWEADVESYSGSTGQHRLPSYLVPTLSLFSQQFSIVKLLHLLLLKFVLRHLFPV